MSHPRNLWVWMGSPDDKLDVLRYVRATDADVLRHPAVRADRCSAAAAATWAALDALYESKGQGAASEQYDDPVKAIRAIADYIAGEDELAAKSEEDHDRLVALLRSDVARLVGERDAAFDAGAEAMRADVIARAERCKRASPGGVDVPSLVANGAVDFVVDAIRALPLPTRKP